MRNAFEVAVKLLEQVTDEFDKAGVELPQVRYVAPGATVAYDGAQITVNLSSIGQGSVGADQGIQLHGAEVFYGEYIIAIVRDTPSIDESMQPPSPAAMQASAEQNMTDVVTLTQAMVDIRGRCGPDGGGIVDSPWLISVTSAEPAGPEGGIVAAVAVAQVQLI